MQTVETVDPKVLNRTVELTMRTTKFNHRAMASAVAAGSSHRVEQHSISRRSHVVAIERDRHVVDRILRPKTSKMLPCIGCGKLTGGGGKCFTCESKPKQ